MFEDTNIWPLKSNFWLVVSVCFRISGWRKERYSTFIVFHYGYPVWYTVSNAVISSLQSRFSVFLTLLKNLFIYNILYIQKLSEMYGIDPNAFVPIVREILLPIGIVAGSFVLRKIAWILEKLFKTLEEFLATFTRVSGAFLLAYLAITILKFVF